MKRGKASTLERRHAAVREAILSGASSAEIRVALAKKLRASEKQIGRYIKTVEKQLVAEGGDLPTAMLKHLYKQAVSEGKPAAAAAILRQIDARKAGNGQDAFESLGPPNLEDPFAGEDYARRGILLELYELDRDKTISRGERSRERSRLVSSLEKLMPHAAIFVSEKKARDAEAQAEQTPARTLENAKDIPTRPLRAAAPLAQRGRRPVRPPQD